MVARLWGPEKMTDKLLTVEDVERYIANNTTRFGAYDAVNIAKQLAETMRKTHKMRDALEKIDWYLQISDNHPMVQKNVQKCRKIIAEGISI